MTNVDPHRLCQIELTVTDVARAIRFYEEVLGWAEVPAEIHSYVLLSVPSECPFGIALVAQATSNHDRQGSDHSETNGRITLYFHCSDPEPILARVVPYGGRLVGKVLPLPSYGVIHRFEDPDGNRFGLYSSLNA